MNAAVLQLEETGSALRNALASSDWAAIGELDLQCRQAVEDALSDATADGALLRERMESLLALYREIVSACQREQQRIAGALIEVNQARQGAKVYQLFG